MTSTRRAPLAAQIALAIPPALLSKNIGGVNLGQRLRKENFLGALRPFLGKLAEGIGLSYSIEVEPGRAYSPGIATLTIGHCSVRVTENKRDEGPTLSLRLSPDDVEPTLMVRLEELAHVAGYTAFVADLRQRIRNRNLD